MVSDPGVVEGAAAGALDVDVIRHALDSAMCGTGGKLLALQAFDALLAERDEALSSLEELAESAETYRQAVEGRVAVLVAALREIANASVNGADDGWDLQNLARAVLAGGEAAGQEEM